MPRYPSTGLESLAGSANSDSLLQAALRDAPLVTRNYSNVPSLRQLRLRLDATKRWTARLNASVPTKLMVAVSLRPEMLGRVFDDLLAECERAAPPIANAEPSADVKRWQRGPSSPEAKANRLICGLAALGEHVGGCWTWVPSGVATDGLGDDHNSWELEYNPPTLEMKALVETLGLLDGGDARFDDAFRGRASVVHDKLRRVTASASDDVRSELQDRNPDGTLQVAVRTLRENKSPVLRLHTDFVSLVNRIRNAARNSEDVGPGWWSDFHRRLVEQSASWLEQMPSAMQMPRGKRQAYKRGMHPRLMYLSQYVLLLRANAASYELVKMVEYLQALCGRLGDILGEIVRQDSAASGTARVAGTVGHGLDRMIVSADMEQRWRDALGEKARGAGRLIVSAVGEDGQAKALALGRLLDMATTADLLTARTETSRRASLEKILVDMQHLGLAAKVPVALFRRVDTGVPRTGRRRSVHEARDWWFNPLGAILAQRAR